MHAYAHARTHTHTHTHIRLWFMKAADEEIGPCAGVGWGVPEDWIPIVGNQDTIFRFFPLGIIFPASKRYIMHGTHHHYHHHHHQQQHWIDTRHPNTESRAEHRIWTLPICNAYTLPFPLARAVIIIESWAWTRAFSFSLSPTPSVHAHAHAQYIYIAKNKQQ